MTRTAANGAWRRRAVVANRRRQPTRPPGGLGRRQSASADGGLFSRLAEHAIAIVTILGLALYVLMRLPYGIYYGRLGSSPEEVGLNYVALLSQSAVGVTAAIAVVLIGALLISAPIAYFAGVRFILRARLHREKNHASTSDDEIRRSVVSQRSALAEKFPRMTSAWPSVEHSVERIRLYHLGKENRSAEQDRRLKELQPSFRMTLELQNALILDLAAIGRKMLVPAAIIVGSAVGLVGMPLLAWEQAERVANCEEAGLGSLGILGLRGERVTFSLGEKSDLRLPSGDYFFLGASDAQYVVYDCTSGETLRVPRKDDVVVITS